jgi:hypothetical protein
LGAGLAGAFADALTAAAGLFAFAAIFGEGFASGFFGAFRCGFFPGGFVPGLAEAGGLACLAEEGLDVAFGLAADRALPLDGLFFVFKRRAFGILLKWPMNIRHPDFQVKY